MANYKITRAVKPCSRCNGTGTQTQYCRQCSGTGHKKGRECKSCRGQGQVLTSCGKCGGIGTVPA